MSSNNRYMILMRAADAVANDTLPLDPSIIEAVRAALDDLDDGIGYSVTCDAHRAIEIHETASRVTRHHAFRQLRRAANMVLLID